MRDGQAEEFVHAFACSGQPDPNARTFQLSTRPDPRVLLFHPGGDHFYISIALSVCSYLVPHVDRSRMTAFIYVIGRSDRPTTRLLNLTTMTSTQWQHPKLPSVLPAVPAVQDGMGLPPIMIIHTQ